MKIPIEYDYRRLFEMIFSILGIVLCVRSTQRNDLADFALNEMSKNA
jgi:hypothetical protein